jgi:cytochrome P450
VGYGNEMKRQRKIMQKALGANSIHAYHPMIDQETRGFMDNLMKSPEDFRAHLLR